MKRRLFMIATAVATLPSLAPAESPEKLEASLSTELAADAATVWAAIGDFQDMSWHPAIYATTGTGGNTAGATRHLVLGAKDGPTIDETLVAHAPDAMRYSYRIAEVKRSVLPVTDYSGEISVMPRDGGGATVTWQSTFQRADYDKIPTDSGAIAAVQGVYKAGLDALVARFGMPGS